MQICISGLGLADYFSGRRRCSKTESKTGDSKRYHDSAFFMQEIPRPVTNLILITLEMPFFFFAFQSPGSCSHRIVYLFKRETGHSGQPARSPGAQRLLISLSLRRVRQSHDMTNLSRPAPRRRRNLDRLLMRCESNCRSRTTVSDASASWNLDLLGAILTKPCTGGPQPLKRSCRPLHGKGKSIRPLVSPSPFSFGAARSPIYAT